MRFLLINYEYPPVGAGAANATRHISRCLVDQGHEVGVLTARFGDLRDWALERGVQIYRCPALRAAAERSNVVEMASFIAGGTLSLPRVMKRLRPEACVAFFSIPGGPVALAANLFWRVPYVVSLRGGDVPGSENTLKWTHRLLAPLRRAILARSRAVVANSDGLKRLTERADPYSACVIPSGVDAQFYSPGPRPGDGVFRILFVGRFHPQKNLALLVEQFSRAMRLLPGRELRLEMIGDGPERAGVEAKVAELGLEARVKLRGWLPRDVLRDSYRAADCLVNPSSGEGLPNVVLEAMACGVAIVASRVAGNDTLVRDGVNGLLFDMDRPDGLGDALARLAGEPFRAESMGAAGREMALAQYSWSSVARRYADLFASSVTS